MAGAYCRYCDRRCFVPRRLPDSSFHGHMATCSGGMAHDRRATGHDHTTAINAASDPGSAGRPAKTDTAEPGLPMHKSTRREETR